MFFNNNLFFRALKSGPVTLLHIERKYWWWSRIKTVRIFSNGIVTNDRRWLSNKQINNIIKEYKCLE